MMPFIFYLNCFLQYSCIVFNLGLCRAFHRLLVCICIAVAQNRSNQDVVLKGRATEMRLVEEERNMPWFLPFQKDPRLIS